MRGIALVHGAHVGSGCWDFVASELRDRGHQVEAIDLHQGSLAEDTLAAQEVVDGFAGAVVACGCWAGVAAKSGDRSVDRVARSGGLAGGAFDVCRWPRGSSDPP